MSENYPEIKNPRIEKPKIKLSFCPLCTRNNWTEYTHGCFCRTLEFDINTIKQRHVTDKKLHRQDRYFSSRLPYANKETREVILLILISNIIQQGV